MRELFLDLWQQKTSLAAVLYAGVELAGVERGMAVCLLWLLVADFCSGAAAAIREKKWSDLRFLSTVNKVTAYLTSIFLLGILVNYTADVVDFDLGWALRIYVVYLMSIECLSILQNCKKLGVRYPPLLEMAFSRIKSGIETKIKHRVGKGGQEKTKT